MNSYPADEHIEEVTIESDSHELVCRVDADRGAFLLTRGAAEREHPEDYRSEAQQSVHHDSKVQVFPTQNDATAYYLSILQTNALITEDEAYGHLIDADVDTVAYEQWRAEFSQEDRVRRLINDARERVDTFGSPWDYAILTESTPLDGVAYSPSLRSTTPSEEALAVTEEVMAEVPETTSCYRRSYNVLELIEQEIGGGTVAYCEGLVMGKHPGRSSTHAWLEVDGEVIEPTWAWDGLQPTDEAVYYGDAFPLERVHAVADSRPVPGSLLLSDEVYYTHLEKEVARQGPTQSEQF